MIQVRIGRGIILSRDRIIVVLNNGIDCLAWIGDKKKHGGSACTGNQMKFYSSSNAEIRRFAQDDNVPEQDNSVTEQNAVCLSRMTA